jgi:MFS family permease
MLPLMLTAAVSSVVSGQLSDKFGGRRRIFVEVASFIMAAATLGMVFTKSFNLCLMIGVFFGLGYGIYSSIDFAIVLDILPSEVDRAKDLAVWHQSLVLPQVIATPIGEESRPKGAGEGEEM